MKLRNKKTGEIRTAFVQVVLENNHPAKPLEFKTQLSIAELNEGWEDYKEPKDWGKYIISCGDNYIEPVCAGFSDKTIEKCFPRASTRGYGLSVKTEVPKPKGKNKLDLLPNECSMFINVTKDISGIFTNQMTSENQIAFHPDLVNFSLRNYITNICNIIS
jgi:hypothetical protein